MSTSSSHSHSFGGRGGGGSAGAFLGPIFGDTLSFSFGVGVGAADILQNLRI
jgi:hypothetical protein